MKSIVLLYDSSRYKGSQEGGRRKDGRRKVLSAYNTIFAYSFAYISSWYWVDDVASSTKAMLLLFTTCSCR